MNNYQNIDIDLSNPITWPANYDKQWVEIWQSNAKQGFSWFRFRKDSNDYIQWWVE